MQGAGFRVQGAGCRVQGAGFRVQGAGFRVQGACPRGGGSARSTRTGSSIPARMVDIRLPAKGKLSWRKAGPLKIVSMIEWIRTSRLSIKLSLSGRVLVLEHHPTVGLCVGPCDVPMGGCCFV